MRTKRVNLSKVKKISSALAHGIFVNMEEDRKRTTSKNIGYKIVIRALQPCDLCTTGNTNQASEHVPAMRRNKSVFLDISKIKKANNGKKLT